MIADYHSDVQCRFPDATRDQIETWLDHLTGIGEDRAPANMFDVDFSASLSRSQQRVGVQAAHRVPRPRSNRRVECWKVFQTALSHTSTLLATTDALAYLAGFEVEVSCIIKGEEIAYTFTASGPHSIKVTEATTEDGAPAAPQT